jgi:hypothetical protein
VSHRPLVLVTGLTVGDYLLWNWSLNGNHTVLALVSGLTLPPLAVACLWLLTMAVARLIASSAKLPARRAKRTARAAAKQRRSAGVRAAGAATEEPATAATAGRSPSRKLAA